MKSLAGNSCTACRKGAPPATADQIASYLDQLPGWRLIEPDGVKRLQKTYQFKNFAQALQFTRARSGPLPSRKATTRRS